GVKEMVLNKGRAPARAAPRAGGDDRRYFSIVWDGASEPLRIPEEHAPTEVVRLWKQGTL
ncbi:protealysin inhibitor emfourin, partial [Xanthomonas oryzae]|uniref:protealysin inhibitor emfourin n=1 Tax=Xanthomonas oryzae TaxID=347 RepID=UPI000949FB5C